MAFLTKNLKIILRDDREEKREDVFHYEGGIREFVSYLNRSTEPLYEPIIYCSGMKDDVYVEVAMQHNDSYSEGTYSFVNNITTPEGGTHVVGFRNALTKTFNAYAKKNKLIKENEQSLSGDDIREGLTAIISVKIPEPQFEGQTKQKLGNSEARGAVDSIVSAQLEVFLEQNPSVAKVIIEKSLMAQRAREAARKARILPAESLPLRRCPFLESWQTVLIKIQKTVRSTSWKVIPPADPQRRPETGLPRRSFRFVERFSTWKKHVLTKFMQTRRSKR